MPAVSAFFPTNFTNYTNLFFCCAGGTKKNASPDRVLNADGFILSKLAVICLPDCVIQAGNRDSKKACRFLIHRIQFRMVSQKRIVNPCALYIRVASAEGRQEPEWAVGLGYRYLHVTNVEEKIDKLFVFRWRKTLRVIRAIRWQIASDCLLMPAVSAFFPTNYANYTNLFFFVPSAQRKTLPPTAF